MKANVLDINDIICKDIAMTEADDKYDAAKDQLMEALPANCNGCNSANLKVLYAAQAVIEGARDFETAKSELLEDIASKCVRGSIRNRRGEVVHCGQDGAPCSMGAPVFRESGRF